MKIPRWAQVLIGVAIVGAFLAVGALIAVTAYFSQHVAVAETTAGDADTAFEEVRKRFNQRPPLIEMRNGVPHYVAARAEAPATPAQPIKSLHILAWDADEEKLARIEVPWWIVRLKSGPIEFSSYASGLDDAGVSLRPEEIESHGPGILVEMTVKRDHRVLLWTQ
jgi:hypothetical protein